MSESNLQRSFEKVLEQVPQAKELIAAINHPDDIDRVTTEQQVPARLYNFHLATKLSTPVGKGLHVPVQISQRSGGRSSVFFLTTNTEIVTGALITDKATYNCYVRRDTGHTPIATSGDAFTFRYARLDGSEETSNKYIIEILEEKDGIPITARYTSPVGELDASASPIEGTASWFCTCIQFPA